MVADQLAARHFTAQDALPDDVQPVELQRLNSFLRGLLLLDGTVSRALEAETLHPVEVEPVEQTECEAGAAVAAPLQIADGERCIRRRVVMHIASPTPSVWGESYVVPQRLPEAFLNALTDNSQGIGGSLQQLLVAGPPTLVPCSQLADHGIDPRAFLGWGEPRRDEHDRATAFAVGADRPAPAPAAPDLDVVCVHDQNLSQPPDR